MTNSERLTKRNQYGHAIPDALSKQIGREILEKLAAYEDAGLSPDEVAALARAQREGRVYVAPCKDGTPIYCHVLVFHGDEGDIIEVVEGIYQHGVTEDIHGTGWWLTYDEALKALEGMG